MQPHKNRLKKLVKNKKIIIIILLFNINLIDFGTSIPPPDEEGKWRETNIFASNLKVRYDETQQDISTNIGGKKVKDLTSYTPNEKSGTYYFNADITLDFQAIILTTVSADDVLEYSTRKTRSVRWLSFYARTERIIQKDDWQITHHDVNYYDYTFDNINELGGFGLDGFYKFQPEFVDVRPEYLTFNDGRYEFNTVGFESTIKELKLTDSKYVEVGEYEDYFWADTTSAEFGEIVNVREEEDKILTAFQDLFGVTGANVDQEAMQYIDNNDIGVVQGPITERSLYPSKNKVKSIIPQGLYLSLKPEISVYDQEITGNYGHLIYDTGGDNEGLIFSETDYGTTYTTPISKQRIIGVHSYNQLMKLDFEVTFQILSEVEIKTSDVSDQDELKDPLYELDDMYYNALLWGDVSASFYYDDTDFLEQFTKWMKWIGIILIIGVVVYFGLPIFSNFVLPIFSQTVQNQQKRSYERRARRRRERKRRY